MKVWYEDGPAAVTLKDGRKVERGEKSDVPKDLGDQLVAQGWRSDTKDKGTKGPSHMELKARAKELGVSPSGKKAELEERIAAAEAAGAEENSESAEATEADAQTPEAGQEEGKD